MQTSSTFLRESSVLKISLKMSVHTYFVHNLLFCMSSMINLAFRLLVFFRKRMTLPLEVFCYALGFTFKLQTQNCIQFDVLLIVNNKIKPTLVRPLCCSQKKDILVSKHQSSGLQTYYMCSDAGTVFGHYCQNDLIYY